MTEKRPNGSGNSLRDYRIGKVEELIEKHDDRITLLENFVIASRSGDSIAKYLKVGVVILAGLGTLIGAGYSFLR